MEVVVQLPRKNFGFEDETQSIVMFLTTMVQIMAFFLVLMIIKAYKTGKRPIKFRRTSFVY